MTTTNTPITLRRRIYRRAITVTALAAFVTTTAVTLLAPVPAAAHSPALSSVASERVAVARKKSRDKNKSAKSAASKAKSTKKSKAKKKSGKLVGVVNINTASASDLEMLPGVGPTKAERVVDHRSKRGKFRRVKDLRRVKGFGRKSLTKLAPYLTIKGPTTIAIAESAD
jgi:competence protein ComEA